MSIRVGINGFGRIGRLTFRAIHEKFGLDGDVQVVALNDLTDAKTNAHLLEFDSNYGPFKGTVATDGNDLVVDGRTIKVFAERDPGAIPWGSEKVDIVVESTGFFTDATKAVAHKRDSVKKVVISAPAKKPASSPAKNEFILELSPHNPLSPNKLNDFIIKSFNIHLYLPRLQYLALSICSY